jgi:hypothetical protein
MWLQSPGTVVDNLLVGHEARSADLPMFRAINVPGISVAVREMIDALRDVAGADVAERVQWRFDPVIDAIVATWPSRFDARIGVELGMRADADFSSIVRAYIAESARS